MLFEGEVCTQGEETIQLEVEEVEWDEDELPDAAEGLVEVAVASATVGAGRNGGGVATSHIPVDLLSDALPLLDGSCTSVDEDMFSECLMLVCILHPS